MACGAGSSKVTSRSSTHWAGRSTKCVVIPLFVATGFWHVALSHFVGGKPFIIRMPMSQLSSLPCPNHHYSHKKSVEPNPRPSLAWPLALRQVRAWLEPYIMLKRYWQAFSPLPPPLPLQRLLDWLWLGNGIYIYSTA